MQARSTAPLCVVAISILALTSLGIGCEFVHAALDPILPEPLLKQGILPPEEADGPFRYWSQRKKYFLVIAVNQTDVPKTELPFAQVDGQRVVNALTGLGYQPVDPAHPLLTGKDATASAIVACRCTYRSTVYQLVRACPWVRHGAGILDLGITTISVGSSRSLGSRCKKIFA